MDDTWIYILVFTPLMTFVAVVNFDIPVTILHRFGMSKLASARTHPATKNRAHDFINKLHWKSVVIGFNHVGLLIHQMIKKRIHGSDVNHAADKSDNCAHQHFNLAVQDWLLLLQRTTEHSAVSVDDPFATPAFARFLLRTMPSQPMPKHRAKNFAQSLSQFKSDPIDHGKLLLL